jgi:hypothetical protein
MRLALPLLVLLVLAPLPALAEPAPTPVEVQKVLDFYYGPQTASPILVQSMICRDVVAEGEQKNQCSETISPNALRVGEVGYLWLNFMVPRSAGPQQILIQFEHGGTTRMTRQIEIGSAIRYRTWKRFELDRPGEWSVKILHDRSDGVHALETLKLAAQPPEVAALEPVRR